MATTKNKLFASAEKKTTKKSTKKETEKEVVLNPEMDEELSNGRGDDDEVDDD